VRQAAALRSGVGPFFLYAFPKNVKANISSKEEAALSLAAADFLAATEQQVHALIMSGAVWEVGDE
jgi:hypothetical protein